MPNQLEERKRPKVAERLHSWHPTEKITPRNRRGIFSGNEWTLESPSMMPVVRRAPTWSMAHEVSGVDSSENQAKEKAGETIFEKVPAQVSSSVASESDPESDDDSDSDADDLETHLEEVSRLKRWGHFDAAIEYCAANLEHHSDLPLVVLAYADLLLEQGSYHQLVSFVSSQRWDHEQKQKCLPISSDEKGPDLYGLLYDLIGLRARLPFESLSLNDLELLQTDSFAEYLNKRVNSRHVAARRSGQGLPFDSTEVQIIHQQLEIRSDVRCKGATQVSVFETHCWPELYNDLLMDSRIWELSDLLLAMFRFFGLSGTWERLFYRDDKKKDKTAQTIEALERLLQDWTMDGYDPSTELALLTILVEIMYMLDVDIQSPSILRKDRILSLKRSKQQADQCAADIKAQSPHLTRSRPYLQWALAKESIDRQTNRSASHRKERKKQIEQVPGIVLKKWCLPLYIPVATENAGWPSPDPKFPPTESLTWALKSSKELFDYKTHSMILRELICRVEDPRPLFKELDQLYGKIQVDLVELYESCISQYLLATDDLSSRQLLERLQAVASQFKPAAEDDACVATRWNGLMVQNALARLVSEDTELIDQNVRTAQLICQRLPYSQEVIDRIDQPTPGEEKTTTRFAGQGNYEEPARQDKLVEQKCIDLRPSEPLFSKVKNDPPEETQRARQELTRWYGDEFRRQMNKLEVYEIQNETKELEKKLRQARLRRELAKFEDEERLKAGKEKILRRLRMESSERSPTLPNEATSSFQRLITAEEDERKDDYKEIKGQPQHKILEDEIPITHEPEERDHSSPADEKKETRTSQKPYHFASVAELQDEPTTFNEPRSPPAGPGRPNDLNGPSMRRPSSQASATRPQATSRRTGRILIEEIPAGENNKNSREESDEYVETWEEVSSEEERPSEAGSSALSSTRDSQVSGEHKPRMIEYSGKIID